MTWLGVWSRAVIGLAFRRAVAVWVGTGIVGAMLFGPTAMHPSDVMGLALHEPMVFATLAVTWLLVFLPAARIIVRGEAAAYLRALPGPAVAPIALGGAALIALQLPWLALWTLGEGARGLAIVVAETMVIVAIARVRPPRTRAGWPGWRASGAALRAIHVRALVRRAGDALVRAAGLAILAGVAAGLFVRNNALAGADAAVLGAPAIAVVLVPALAGLLLVAVETHRSTAWLAASLGISRGTRVAALATALCAVYGAATLVALAAAAIVARLDASTFGWLAATSLGVAVGSALGATRLVLAAASSVATDASRIVAGAIAVSAACVVAFGLLQLAGLAAFVAATLAWLIALHGGDD